MEAYAGRQFVGMDLHRRRSVLVRMTAEHRFTEQSTNKKSTESKSNSAESTASSRSPNKHLTTG
jgi:hypothetical protein